MCDEHLEAMVARGDEMEWDKCYACKEETDLSCDNCGAPICLDCGYSCEGRYICDVCLMKL